MQLQANPLVSVVVPMFNAEIWISSLLLSITNQTYNEIEIIIVDDGSTDSSAQIVSDFARDNPNFKIEIVSQPNSGVSEARNQGVKRATGNLIAFVDSDDLWLSNKIERQVEAMGFSKSGVVACSYAIFTDSNMKVVEVVHPDWTIHGVRNWLLFRSYGGLLSSTLMIQREVYDEVGQFESTLSLSADIEFAWRMLKVAQVDLIREPLVAYRLRPNQMHKLPNLLISEAQRMVETVDLFEDHKYQEIILSNLNLRLALYAFQDRHIIQGLKHLKSASKIKFFEAFSTLLRIILKRFLRKIKNLKGIAFRLPNP